MLQLDSISDFNLMSFPINMCSHNKDDVLSWEMVFYHVRSINLHCCPFTVFKLSTQQGHSEYQFFFCFFFQWLLNMFENEKPIIFGGFFLCMGHGYIWIYLKWMNEPTGYVYFYTLHFHLTKDFRCFVSFSMTGKK